MLRKRLCSLTIVALVFVAMLNVVVPVHPSPVNKPIQITTDSHYDRNPSLLQDDDCIYWLFFTRGIDERGVRGFNDYNPDTDLYDIYYKTSTSLSGLKQVVENKVPGSNPNNGQRDVAALQASDGKIWVFSSTGFGPGVNHIYYFIYDDAWSGPTAISFEESKWIGHIDAVENNGKIVVIYDAEYVLKALYYDGIWHGPFEIKSEATLGKAIVDKGILYVVWSYLDPNQNIWGGYIGLSTSHDGINWVNHGQIASWPDATNWDPILVKDRNIFRLFWAPDKGSEGQFIATSQSSNPTTFWDTPIRVTSASYGNESWWDFWPELNNKGKIGGSLCMFYTSEKNTAGTKKIDGNIWMYAFLSTRVSTSEARARLLGRAMLEAGEGGTASWKLKGGYNGNYGVMLSIPDDAGEDAYAEVSVPVDLALEDIDLSRMYFWCKVTAGDWSPYFIFELANGERINSDSLNSAGWMNTWRKVAANGHPGGQWQRSSDGFWYASWAAAVADFGADTRVVRVYVELSGLKNDAEPDFGPFTAYIDDIGIIENLYYLEWPGIIFLNKPA